MVPDTAMELVPSAIFIVGSDFADFMSVGNVGLQCVFGTSVPPLSTVATVINRTALSCPVYEFLPPGDWLVSVVYSDASGVTIPFRAPSNPPPMVRILRKQRCFKCYLYNSYRQIMFSVLRVSLNTGNHE